MAKNEEPSEKWRKGTVCLNEWTNKAKNKDDEEIEFKNYSINASYFDKDKKEYVETTSMTESQLSRLYFLIGEALKSGITKK